MTEQQTTLLSKIIPYLNLIEKIFLTGLATGLAFTFFTFDNNKAIIKFSFVGLAISYLLMAFKYIEIPRQEGEKFGFKELLAWIIIPKIIWISCAISLLGFFIYILQLGHDGHKRAFMIAGSNIAFGLIVIIYSLFTGTKHLKYLVPTLIRAIPIAIVDFYLLFN